MQPSETASAPLRRILLVEDDPDIQLVARMALEDVGGFEVELCGSGSEALKRGPAFRPHLVLLDAMMPDLDGMATLRALRGVPELARVPVVFLTAKAQTTDIAAYFEAGALDVIKKPFDPLTLHQTIQEIWASHAGNSA